MDLLILNNKGYEILLMLNLTLVLPSYFKHYTDKMRFHRMILFTPASMFWVDGGVQVLPAPNNQKFYMFWSKIFKFLKDQKIYKNDILFLFGTVSTINEFYRMFITTNSERR
jgi:hypothetical protein